MAAKQATKKYDLNAEEQKLIDAMRAVVKAREAKKAHEMAVDNFEELVDNFKYTDEDDDFYSDWE